MNFLVYPDNLGMCVSITTNCTLELHFLDLGCVFKNNKIHFDIVITWLIMMTDFLSVLFKDISEI